GREPPLRRGGRRLFRPPPGQARHHRLGPGQRLARRDRHARKDPAPRRARPLLHRELVSAVRPLHHGHDAGGAGAQRERLLMSAVHTVHAPRLAASVETLRGALLWLTGLFGALVFMEPSPYEIASLLAIIAFVATGISLSSALMPFAIMLVF